MKSNIRFANEKLGKSFEKLKNLKSEDKQLYSWLIRAFEDIEKNPFCGVHISRKLIPKEYFKKFNIKNLYKYDLPNAWRLMYSIEKGNVFIVAIILEWFSHKEYEKRFRYK